MPDTRHPRIPRPRLKGATATVFLALLLQTGTAWSDTRQEIILPPADRDHLLEHMREFLQASNGVLRGVLDEDMDKVVEMARLTLPMRIRDPEAHDVELTRDHAGRTRPERMQAVMPPHWGSMMRQMRQEFMQIAEDARQGADGTRILQRLHSAQEVCIACHEAFRLTPSEG